MTHPYYMQKARSAMERAGGDPENAGRLAEWAERVVNGEHRRRLGGVVVASDGTLICETVHVDGTPSTPGATYVPADEAERLGIAVAAGCGVEIGYAMGALERVAGQPVAHIKPGAFVGPATPAAMDAAEFAALRLSVGVSADVFAQRLDVNPRTVRSWESGRDRISASAAAAIRGLVAEHEALVEELLDAGGPISVERGDKWTLAAAAIALRDDPTLRVVWAHDVA